MSKQLIAASVLAFVLVGCGAGDDVSPETVALTDTVNESGTIARDEWHDYGSFEVVEGGSLRVILGMYNGDADLYARVGQAPTLRDFDCRPYLGGTRKETCEFDGPATVYIAVGGYGWSTDYGLSVAITSPDEPVCGNSVLEAGEVCDGNTVRCFDLDSDEWLSGSATCASDCMGFDTSACIVYPTCGNDIVEINEQCDQAEPLAGSELSDKFASGLAYCDICIGWDSNDCVLVESICGNGKLDYGEVCDGTPRACRDFNPDWIYGEVDCLADCSGWNEASCAPAHEKHFSEWGTLPAGRWRHYVPFNTLAGTFHATIGGTDLGGTGDVDLYVRRDRPPTLGEYDCRSNGPESLETCDLEGPGLFYVAVYGYAATSDYTVQADYMWNYTLPEPYFNERAGNVNANEWVFFGPFHPRGVGDIQVTMAGSNDADLYVMMNSQPSESAYDCRPYANDSNETCHLRTDGSDTLYVGIKGWAARSYFEIIAVHIPD